MTKNKTLEYKIKVDYEILFLLCAVSLLIFILNYLYKLNIYLLGLFNTYLIINSLWFYFTQQVKRIIFIDNESLMIIRHHYFKEKKVTIDFKNLKYLFKEGINYPNKVYILDFYIENKKININKSYNIISFSKDDIKEIVHQLDELNIQKIKRA